MIQWKKFAGLTVLAMALVALSPVFAQAENYTNNSDSTYCDPCYNPCGDACGNWFFGADLIYWKPCIDDLTYAATRPNENNSVFKLHSVDPVWEPGFRLYAGREGTCCELDLAISWTHLNSSSSDKVKKEHNVLPTNSHPGFWNPGIGTTNFWNHGKGSWKSDYNEWDVLFGVESSCSQCHRISHSFGVAGINVDQRLQAKLTGDAPASELVTRWNNDIWGVGLRVGTEFKTNICDCLNLIASGNATVLAGNSTSKTKFDDRGLDENEITFEHTFKEDTNCQLIPGYHVALGLNYETNTCGYDFSVRLGYEFTAWHNFPTQRTYVQSDAGTSAFNQPDVALSTNSNTRTYGFHGVFVGLAAQF